jgi:tRNA1Val (adenine37-N6)-methyltransferase
VKRKAAVLEACGYFPRGLVQPEDGYRFSLDSLLLASFARGAGPEVLDLGCGCGVVGLAVLLTDEKVSVTGVDADPEMIGCAEANAAKLGMAGRFDALACDVREVKKVRPYEPEVFDAVVCNPPYREQGGGRPPRGSRLAARFDSRAGMADFARAAAFGLKNKARFFAVFPPERLAAMFRALADSKLEAKRLKLVYGNADEPAKIALVEARKNGGPGLAAEPPLVLHRHGGLSAEALEFCPFLACNAGTG